MRKYAIGAMVFVLLAGCGTGKIRIVKDDLKGTTLITMDLDHSSDEFLYGSSAAARYAREVSPKGKGPVIVYLKLYTGEYAGDLEKKAIVKAGDFKQEIPLLDISGEIVTEISQKKTTTYKADSTGFVDYSKPVKSESDVNAESHKIINAKLPLTADIENAILKSPELIIRVYFGTNPSTFTINKAKLEKIKLFLVAKPEDAKK